MLSREDISDNSLYYAQWAFGLLFLLTGAGFFTESIISGIITLGLGLFLIPKARNMVLEELGFELPKYTVPIVVVLGVAVAGAFLPTSPSAQFDTISNDLNLETQDSSVVVSGIAEIENTGEIEDNYAVGLYREGELMDSDTQTIEPNETVTFELSYEVEESGTHNTELRSSTSGDLQYAGNGGGEFSLSEEIDVPYTLTDEGVEQLIRNEEDYGLTYTAFENISEVSVNDEVGDTIVIIRHRGDDYRGAEHIAETSVQSSYAATRMIYERFDEVDEITVFTEADFEDEYGNVEEKTAVKISISQETADRMNWDNMETNLVLDYRDWLNVADDYFIYLPVCQDLDVDSCAP